MAERSQRGSNLSREDRERGGRTSASRQVRDERGKFAGAQGRHAAAQSHGSEGRRRTEHGGPKDQNQLSENELDEHSMERSSSGHSTTR